MHSEQRVDQTLYVILKILNKHKVEYRFLGSLVTAAINGSLHRDLGDLDLLVDEMKKEILFKELRQVGYKRAGGMFAFSRKHLNLETLVHDELLSIGYFWGRFGDREGFRMGNQFASVTIKPQSVVPTTYQLNEHAFVGIPERAVAVGIMQSASNPKRKKEVEMLAKKKIKPFADEGISIRVLGIPFDWVYIVSMKVLNVLGKIRVLFGLPFDPWRSKIG